MPESRGVSDLTTAVVAPSRRTHSMISLPYARAANTNPQPPTNRLSLQIEIPIDRSASAS